MDEGWIETIRTSLPPVGLRQQQQQQQLPSRQSTIIQPAAPQPRQLPANGLSRTPQSSSLPPSSYQRESVVDLAPVKHDVNGSNMVNGRDMTVGLPMFASVHFLTACCRLV